jgi:hypothetical protein
MEKTFTEAIFEILTSNVTTHTWIVILIFILGFTSGAWLM